MTTPNKLHVLCYLTIEDVLMDNTSQLVTASDWPGLFPTWSKVVCTSVHHHQGDIGTSIGLGPLWTW